MHYNKFDQYLHDCEFVSRTDHKPLKYSMDSPVQKRKIQHWTRNICDYNCKIECIVVKKNVCADILSQLPYRASDSNDKNEPSGPDIIDKMFEVSMINSSNINPKAFAQYDHQITDNQWTEEELNLPGYNLVKNKG